MDSSRSRPPRRAAAPLAALLLVLSVLVPTLAPAGASDPAPPPPTIASDKADYSAGSTVTLTGANWAPSESVRIVVNDTIGQTWQRDVTVAAAADGTVKDVFSLPGYFVSNYDVTATGPISGTARTTFTDAPASADLDQCRNGSAASPNDCKDFGGNSGWVNGNVGASQAHMLEGYSTPFRTVLENLPTGTDITLTLGYDIRNSGANAYDYLTSYQRLEPHTFFNHPAETVYPTDGVSGLSATTSTYAIPTPSSAGSPVPGEPATSFGGLPAGERNMTLFGGTITDVSYVSQGSLTANQSETQIAVTFHVDNPTAVLAWGGHISQCSVWGTTNGTCNSAGGIDGSPYHMRLVGWGPNLPNLGNTDRSMAAAVVIQPGNLTLSKALTGGPNGYTGPFTIHYDCGTGFIGDVTIASGSSQTINGIPSGQVCTVSEPTLPTAPTGYSFGTPSFSPSNTITIGEGTTVTVTTNNTLSANPGSLKLTKALTGGPAGYTGPFTIHYDCGAGFVGDKSVSAGSFQTVSGIPAGTSCTVSEPTLPTPPTGYSFGTPSFNPTSGTVTVGLGTTVEVITNNTLTRDVGSLLLSKALTGGPSGYTGPFTINWNCGTGHTGSTQVTAGAAAVTADAAIPTGTSCTVSETLPTAPTGYSFGTPSFSPSSTVVIPAGNGSTITVTTNNTLTRDLGSLLVAKTLVGGPSGYNGPFTINWNCGTGHTGSTQVTSGAAAVTVDAAIPTGTSCTVSETLPAPPAGYAFGTPAFIPSNTVTIPAGNGSTITVTTNNRLSRTSPDVTSLRLAKALTGGPSGYSGPFTIAYDCGTGHIGSVPVTAGAAAVVADANIPLYDGNGNPISTTCVISEPNLPTVTGYTFGTPSFSPSATVVLSAANTDVTVTTNNTMTRDLGTLRLSKALTGGPNGYLGPFTIHYDCGTGFVGDKSVFAGSSVIVPGIPTGTSCTVSEPNLPTPPTGFSFGTPSFSPSSTVVIPAGNGSEVEVTTNNTLTRDLGSLLLAKALTGGPSGYNGPFTINWNCGAGHTGSTQVTAGAAAVTADAAIPTGTSCTVAETLPTPPTGYSFGTASFSPSSTVVIPAGSGSTITVTTNNTLTRDLGSLKLAKALTGGPSGYDGPFTINYDCGTGHIGSVPVTAGAVAVTADAAVPTGTSCTVSETLPTPPTGYSFGTPSFSPSSTVVIPAGNGSTITVTTNNSLTRDLGSLLLAKALTGGPSGYDGPFTINWNCGAGHTGSTQVTAGAAAVTADAAIPTGTSCTVSETLPAPPTGYSFGTPSFSPSSTVVIPAGSGSTITVTTNNTLTRDLGSLMLTKALTGGPAGYTGPFTIHYDCGTGFIGDKTVSSGGSQTVSGIPTGTSCTVSEPTLPSVPGYTFGTPTFTPSSGTVTIPAGSGSSITVTTNNTMTRDTGSLVIAKTLSNPDGAPVPATFTANYNCGTGFTGQVTTLSPSTPVTVSGIPTGNTCTVTEVTPTPIPGYTWGTITYTPASVVIATKGASFTITVGNSITRDRGTIVIIKRATPAQGTFAFTTTGAGYNPFNLTGATTNGGNVNTQTLPTGTYTAHESTQLGWTLTGIGGSTDPNTPYACTVSGSSGSTGSGDLNTQTVTVNLQKGDTVTCVFENTGNGATRTQGFWATHSRLANIAWFGGSGFGHTFPGVASIVGDATLCGRPIDTLGKVMGGFWSGISSTSANKKRSALDQARMQLLQQLLAAELNASAFGSAPAGGAATINGWEAAYCGTNQNAIKDAQSAAASFNSRGDNSTFTPGTSADSKNARAIANYAFWDVLP